MKAIIPVAGIGTKLRPHTHTQPKPLMPVAGKPILGHIVDSLLAAGIREQVFIIGYLGEKIQEYILHNYSDKIEASFVVQEPRRGLGQALYLCKAHIQATDGVVVVLGDTIFGDIRQICAIPGNVLGTQEVADPRKFGVAVRNQHRDIRYFVEKPHIPTSNLALVGVYKFADTVLLWNALEILLKQVRPQGQDYLLTDALNLMIDLGASFSTYMVENWYDCGGRETLLRTNKILLDRVRTPDYHFPNTVIIPPVHIAAGCQISHSIIGPNVAIAENSIIRNSIVENSILGAYSELYSIVLKDSVVGNDTSLRGKAHRINIGDNTDIDFDE